MMDICVLVMLVVIFSPLTLHLSSRREVLASSDGGGAEQTESRFGGRRRKG